MINTSRQIGGAIGVAAASAIAAISTSHYVEAHAGVTASSGEALDHGFQTALYVLTGLLLVGALIAAAFLRPSPTPDAHAALEENEAVAFEEAA